MGNWKKEKEYRKSQMKYIILGFWLLSLALIADIAIWWTNDAHKKGLSKLYQASPDRCIEYMQIAECECKGGL